MKGRVRCVWGAWVLADSWHCFVVLLVWGSGLPRTRAAWHASRLCQGCPGCSLAAPTCVGQRQHGCVDAGRARASVRLQHLHKHADLGAWEQLQDDCLLYGVADDHGELGGAPVRLASPPPLACRAGAQRGVRYAVVQKAVCGGGSRVVRMMHSALPACLLLAWGVGRVLQAGQDGRSVQADRSAV